jgi:hypothetical protein
VKRVLQLDVLLPVPFFPRPDFRALPSLELSWREALTGRTRNGRLRSGESINLLLAELAAKPWQTRNELGKTKHSGNQLLRLVLDGRLIRREGKRRFNSYEYALPGAE